MKKTTGIVALLAAMAAAGTAVAQMQNLEKLKQFRVSGTDLNIPVVRRQARTPTRSATTSSASSCRPASRSSCTRSCRTRATLRWREHQHAVRRHAQDDRLAVTDRNGDMVADKSSRSRRR